MLDMDVPIDWSITISVHVALENELRINFLIDNIYDRFDPFTSWIESLN